MINSEYPVFNEEGCRNFDALDIDLQVQDVKEGVSSVSIRKESTEIIVELYLNQLSVLGHAILIFHDHLLDAEEE